jgi:Spy/CpxP family protein refolding chaperone
MSRALQWKLIAGFLLVFLAGGMTGAFLGVTHTRRAFLESRRAIMSERMRDRLRAQLDLTPEQLAKISPIIDKTVDQLGQIRRDTGRRVRDLMNNAHQQMSANLTDTQRVKLQEIEARHRHGHQRGFHRRSLTSPAERETDR